MLIVCGGIGSYFTPTGYVSMDINPSLLMTVNIYNRIIEAKAFNSDGERLLENTDIKGKNMYDSVDILVKASEDMGYLNSSNNDVILEVVSGINKIDLSDKKYTNIEVVVENADKSDLKAAKKMGVSIATAKAIEEYTNLNGGSVEDNAEKLDGKTVKEIRKDIVNATPMPPLKSEIKTQNIPAKAEKADTVSASKAAPTNQPVHKESFIRSNISHSSKYSNKNNIENPPDSTVIISSNQKTFDKIMEETLPNPLQEIIVSMDKKNLEDTAPIKTDKNYQPEIKQEPPSNNEKNNGFIGGRGENTSDNITVTESIPIEEKNPHKDNGDFGTEHDNQYEQQETDDESEKPKPPENQTVHDNKGKDDGEPQLNNANSVQKPEKDNAPSEKAPDTPKEPSQKENNDKGSDNQPNGDNNGAFSRPPENHTKPRPDNHASGQDNRPQQNDRQENNGSNPGNNPANNPAPRQENNSHNGNDSKNNSGGMEHGAGEPGRADMH